MSTFDPDTFMTTQTEGAMETRYIPIPEDDFTAFIEDIGVRGGVGSNDATVLDITYKLVNVEKLQEDMAMESLTVRQSVFLDLEKSGAIALGPNKNVKLGRIREAVGQNNPKKPWSPLMLKGAGPVRIKVTQRADKNDPETKYNDVSRIVKAT